MPEETKTTKIPVRYLGPFEEVFLEISPGRQVPAKRGEAVEVPETIAAELLDANPSSWEHAG